jgi:biopolymer transport protein ExbB
MKTSVSTLVCALVATGALAAALPPEKPAGLSPDLAERARAAVASGEAELSKVRADIEEEKIPLSKSLAAVEEQLIAARKKYDEVRKKADDLTLETTNLNTIVKARADENAYLANIFDEFVRGFEGRVHPGELPAYARLLEETKLATENPNLTETDRFVKRLAVLRESVARLKANTGGRRLSAEVLDPNGVISKGTLALLGPVGVFSTEDKTMHGLVAAQTGSSRPVLRPLPEPMNQGIAQLVATGEGLLPLDPSRGAALQELIKKTSIIDTFLHGGPIMWPILLCSIIAVAVSIERIAFFFLQKSRRRTADIDAIYELANDGKIAKAVALGKGSRDFVARMLSFALTHGQKSLHTAIHKGTQMEVKRFTRGVWILDTCITMAPLLGLLGTVVGMMGSFDAIGRASDAASGANSVIGGIAEALIATAAGLLIAIMSLVPLNFINDQVEAVQHELDDAGRQLELIFDPPTQILVVDEQANPGQSQNRDLHMPVQVGRREEEA